MKKLVAFSTLFLGYFSDYGTPHERQQSEICTVEFDLGTRLRTHNQKITVAARAMADRKTFG
uniref:hypothetical protein n=1 Tax=Parasedimentitalea psychrophila TaxID=2997337 RepID=UPI0022EABC5A